MSLLPNATFHPLSERAIIITLGEGIDPQLHAYVQKVMTALNENPFEGYIESVPSYTGVTVFYDPIKVRKNTYPKAKIHKTVMGWLEERVKEAGKKYTSNSKQHIVEVPVCYGGDFGPDLSDVAEKNELSEEEVIQIHANGEYLVYMIGFAPGFPFIGGMSEEIATPRKEKPRELVPAGAVGIAGAQTGVYPFATPGGWQLIGQTPITLFDVDREQPSLLKSGDMVKFKPISRKEYEEQKEAR
ncbi:5-oxoprolinase subunit PxpB [Oceanobacillus timonensis]|uniref:5-oxoprolinase subunit PxpB n=1 Tax=Oceanobacillus timonensis TaxID=1926285 RepID=UPI0009BC1C88|nr:5-oxoprolinase subunit PxpB [Oceanobacillus timonensis]